MQSIASTMSFLAAFAAILSVAFWWFQPNADSRKALARLRDDHYDPTSDADGHVSFGARIRQFLQGVGTAICLTRTSHDAIQRRMKQAGIHGRQPVLTFLGVKALLSVGMTALLSIAAWSILPGRYVFGAGALGALLGMSAPEFWLSSVVKRRQRKLRQALPDALDMLVLCLEGGISTAGALQRVSAEMRRAHPLLAEEMVTMENEIQLGMSVGEAVKSFATRVDLKEAHELASVLLQSERFGSSIVKPLRMHSDLARQERYRRAEEIAQKAAVKILFPTLLFIFPAVFIVILGPAAYQIANMFSHR
jgi:tight adherence protein C